MKKCNICHEEKDILLFHKSKLSKDGYFKYCKKCHNEKSNKAQIKKLLLKNEDLIPFENEFFLIHYNTGLLVSNLGRVFSPYRETGNKRYSHFLKITKMNNGYFTIAFNNKHIYVHRLVCETFIKNDKNYTHVNHIDFNKENNNLNNLEWCTHLENIEHSVKKDSYSKKLNREQVLLIRKSNNSIDFLSEKFKVTKTNIRLIINKKIWKHL